MCALRVADQAVEIRILPDADAVSREAAQEFVALARQQARARGRCRVALAGGATAAPLHALLASEPYRTLIPWDVVHLFWGDERCVPADHPEGNFSMASDALLSRAPIPPANIHRVPVEQGNPDAVALAYERILRDCFDGEQEAAPAFDLVFLGLGTDGHTASLFPRSDALRKSSQWVVAAAGGTPPRPRVTVTLPVLNHARRLVWLVVGSQKAAVVHSVLEGPPAPDDLPAQQVRPIHTTPLWLIDRAAAAQLTAACRLRAG